jgi:hypothetical protein
MSNRPISEEEEFEPDAPELEESAQPTDGPDLLWGRFLDDMIDGRGGDDQIHGYDGNDTHTMGPMGMTPLSAAMALML